MKIRSLLVLAVAGVAATAAVAAPVAANERFPEPSGEVAVAIDRVVLEGIAVEGSNPVRASRVLAYVSAAMERAAEDSGPASELVVAVAAATVLAALSPSSSPGAHEVADQARVRLVAGGLGREVDAAERRAVAIAKLYLARAAGDGADTNVASPPPRVVGAWQPTPPAFAPALEPAAGSWSPWHLRRGDQFRPSPPLRPGDVGYAEQVAEVYDTARTLTDEQVALARFWADGPGTVTPPGHWNQIALDLLSSGSPTLEFATSVLATLNTAQADAFIACWDAKYAYYTERPVTAIRRDIDATFLPLITTPPFPSYASGHSTTSAAASTVLGAYFPHARSILEAMANEAAVSRLYGGIHFRADNDAGLRLGEQVGETALRRAMHGTDR